MSISAHSAVVVAAAALFTSTITHAGFPDCNANGIDDAVDIGSGTSDDGNTNMIPDECEATILYVDASSGGPMFTGTSWSTAYTDLQDALAVARTAGNAAEQIWITTGTYLPDGGTIDRAASFELIDGVALYGGFAGDEVALGDRDPDANLTTLSGDLGAPADSSDNSFHVVSGDNVGPGTIVDGLTIIGGNANGTAGNAVGGGFKLTDATPTINDCRIGQNEAAASGGGIFCANAAVTETSLTLSDCILDGNQAGVNGGALAGFLVNLAVTNCQFINNSANESGDLGSGGGMWVLGALLMTDGTTFIGNTAGFGGGGIGAGAGTKVLVTGCDFDGNASKRGGGIWVFGDTSTLITNCSFSGNTASATGGGADVEDSIGLFANCTFDGNQSTLLGGAIHANTNAQLHSLSCTFNGNTADVGGGAINSDTGAVTGVVSSTFVGNTSATGGAIRTDAATTATVNSSFFSNSATGAGGAVEDDAASSTYNNCIFAGNSSDGPAGAVHVINATTMTVANCTVTANTGMTGGGVLVDGGAATVVNSILWLNADDGGTDESGQLEALSGTLTLDWSDVQGLTGGLGGSGNIDVNPRFVDPTGDDAQPGTGDEDYSLRDASPCIDAADNALVESDSLDVDGDGDLAEPTPLDHDGNARIVDDPAVTDTGPSAPPVVDMGALEFPDTSSSCPQDLDNDDSIGFSDLTALLAAWGPCIRCVEDIDHNDLVGFSDLTSLLNAWGDCPL